MPQMYCPHCSYILDGLPVNRCPECGRTFDPTDIGLADPPRRVNWWIPPAIYLIPFSISFLLWVPVDSSKWQGYGFGMPLQGRIDLWLMSCCGPIAWVLFEAKLTDTIAVVATFSGLWGAWLLLVGMTKLRCLPWWAHLVMGFAWCFAGCAPCGLVVS